VPYNLTVSGNNLTTTTWNLEDNITVGESTITLNINTKNSIFFSFYDLETLTLINTTEIDLELISTTYSTNYTINTGYFYVDLLAPETYDLRIRSEGYSESDQSYDLLEGTTGNIIIYLNALENQTLIAGYILDKNTGSRVEGATIKIQRFIASQNAFVQTNQLVSDYDGNFLFYANFNSEYYKFIVEYPTGTTKLITTPSYIYSTTIELKITTGSVIETPYDTYSNLIGTISFNNVSNRFVGTFNNGATTTVDIIMRAYSLDKGVKTLLNSTTTDGTSGTIYTGVDYDNSTNYYGTISYIENGNEYILDDAYYYKLTNPDIDDRTSIGYLILLCIVGVILTTINIFLGLMIIPILLIIFISMGLISSTAISLSVATALLLVSFVIGFIVRKSI